jgi:hypothetical protein
MQLRIEMQQIEHVASGNCEMNSLLRKWKRRGLVLLSTG